MEAGLPSANAWGVPPSGSVDSSKGLLVGGTSGTSSRSFCDVLAGSSSAKDPTLSFSKSFVNGVPAILMSDDDIFKLASPF
ncbi:hypothetical protein IEQ34_006769 [Dendrobium chrysotoxum]|uniref:Uncharacterized protein n=1 Tax=Dendrobium chrysotoxum TaxID=161865 RepID=A0AAV7H940_DENCH|nr:hypothetical protein IEQ34_006769 [Dendrobium chrysotoxum]